jgi:hypothetical protein
MRSYLRFLFFSLLFMSCAWLQGCTTLSPAENSPTANASERIYFIRRDWHTSVMIEASVLAKQSPMLAKHLEHEKFARVGFGDGEYFTGRNNSTWSATRALFMSPYSALQLLTYSDSPFDQIPLENIVPLAITPAGLSQLIAFINQSIAKNPQGRAIELPAQGDAMGFFYQGSRHYSVFGNCNNWSMQALAAAGLPVSSQLTASGAFAKARAISSQQASAGLFKSPPY